MKSCSLDLGELRLVKVPGKRQEGIALVITLLVMTLLLIMGSAFLSISSTETLISINERNRLQAFNLAEAGAERVLAELNVNEGYAGTGGDQGLGFGTYMTTVTDLPPLPGVFDRKQVVSTGYVPNSAVLNRAMTQVQVVAQRGSPFQVGLLGLSVVELEDRVVVDSYDSSQGLYDPATAGTDGHIYSNGDIALLTNNTVNGNALAAQTVTLGAGSTITGSVTEGVPSATVVTDTSFPPPTGDLIIGEGETVTLDAGTYAFNDVTVGANGKLDVATGPVLIYMTGNFHAYGGAMINASGASTRKPTDLIIYNSASGDNIVKGYIGGGEFYGAVYALNGEVEFEEGGWKIFGAIIAQEVDLEDDARFHYDVALTKPSLPAGKFRPATGTWREIFP